MRLVAFLVAYLVTGLVLASTAPVWMEGARGAQSAAELLLITSSFTVLALLAGLGAYWLALAGLVLVSRGTKAVALVRPSSCSNFSSWLSHSWRFYSNGRQEGCRFFGLEIALSGTLH